MLSRCSFSSILILAVLLVGCAPQSAAQAAEVRALENPTATELAEKPTPIPSMTPEVVPHDPPLSCPVTTPQILPLYHLLLTMPWGSKEISGTARIPFGRLCARMGSGMVCHITHLVIHRRCFGGGRDMSGRKNPSPISSSPAKDWMLPLRRSMFQRRRMPMPATSVPPCWSVWTFPR